MDSIEKIRIHNQSHLNDCRIITLNRHQHANGNLTAINNGVELPFDIKRTFYIYDVPGGAERGGHSHYTCHEFIIAISGSFDVTIDDSTTITPIRSTALTRVCWSCRASGARYRISPRGRCAWRWRHTTLTRTTM